MAGELIYAFRVMRLPLLDAGGAAIGRIDDIVVVPGTQGRLPRVVGFVAEVQRRRIFVNANRLATLAGDGARLSSWDVDLNPFKPHAGEVLVGADSSIAGSATRPSAMSPCARVGTPSGHGVGDRQGPPRAAQRAAPPAELPARRRRRDP